MSTRDVDPLTEPVLDTEPQRPAAGPEARADDASVLELWRTGKLDTFDIANRLGRSEADVVQALVRARRSA